MILAGVISFIEEFLGDTGSGAFNTEGLSIQNIIAIVIIVFLASILILAVYKRTYQTTVYNRSFAISLPLLSMITAVIIIAVSSNLLLSLGMVGALSIVRFRTAIKNPLDTVFVFWAVGLGITAGANLLILAIASTLLISITLYLLVKFELLMNSYFLIIRAGSYQDETEILDNVKGIYGKFTLRNKTVKKDQLDLTLEVRSKEDKYTLINQIQDIESVRSVILLSHQGDYISE